MAKRNLLLVEDNPHDVFAFERTFRKAGLEDNLTVLVDGRAALQYLGAIDSSSDSATPRPELIFLDLKLPMHSGHEILEWIQGESNLTSIPVVVLSGSDEQRDHDRALKNGAQDYLVKPLSVENLQHALSYIQDSDLSESEA